MRTRTKAGAKTNSKFLSSPLPLSSPPYRPSSSKKKKSPISSPLYPSSSSKKKKSPISSPSPSPSPSSSSHSPSKPYQFNITRLSTATATAAATTITSSRKGSKPPPLLQPENGSSSPHKTPATISDLKHLVSSRVDSLKKHLDLCHSEILKDFEASSSRLSKRFKMQSQACIQVMGETEKEYKKMSDDISENMKVMKASYTEFITEAQAAASRVCKGTIPELADSLEKGIGCLRSRYGVPLTAK